MRYPAFLQPGGCIGFVAPSFGCTTEPYKTRFESAKAHFAGRGYAMLPGPNCYADKGTGKSNTPEKCAEELNAFFTREACDVLLSCGGGETMCEDLPFVDFSAIAKASPKWYMGYSDNTCLTFTLPTLCDTAAIYGPCAPGFGMRRWHPALLDAFSLLTGEKLRMESYDAWELEEAPSANAASEVDALPDPLADYNAVMPSALRFFDGDGKELTAEDADGADAENRPALKFSGRLLGGCLDVLICLCGTEFDKVKAFNERYAADGIVWFLEACELNPIGVRRALWQLKNAGWFDNAAGFVVGRPMSFGCEVFGETHEHAVLQALEPFGKPIVMHADLGHLPPAMPIISGAMADITADFAADGMPKLTIDHRLE